MHGGSGCGVSFLLLIAKASVSGTLWEYGRIMACVETNRGNIIYLRNGCQSMGRFIDSPRSLLLLAGCILATNAAGFLGSLVTETGPGSWYVEDLVKPWFVPPSIVFPVVWTTLFILMGIALYLVLRKGIEEKDVRIAVAVFGVQLILNIAWSFAFFGLQSPFAGLIVIFILWCAILATIWYFFRVEKAAAYLLVPYIAWVSFAALINATILLIN